MKYLSAIAAALAFVAAVLLRQPLFCIAGSLFTTVAAFPHKFRDIAHLRPKKIVRPPRNVVGTKGKAA